MFWKLILKLHQPHWDRHVTGNPLKNWWHDFIYENFVKPRVTRWLGEQDDEYSQL